MVTTFNNDIQGFIKSLDLPQESKVLFQTFGDCHSFYINHYGRNNCITDDLLDYRERKIEESKITLDMFVDMCYTKGVAFSFERTFFQKFDSQSVELITNSLLNEKTTLETIYSGFKKNPNKNILKYVL